MGGVAIPRSGPSVLARRPEIAPITATAIAWVALIIWAIFGARADFGAWVTLGSAVAGPFAADGAGHAGHSGVFTPSGLTMVTLMTVAMMAPQAIHWVRDVAITSASSRAGRAGLWFLASYLAVWTAFAVCLAPVAQTLAGVLGSPASAAAILVLACALAQFDPQRIVPTRACHLPVRPRGTGPDGNVDCARCGLLSAAGGLRLCALPMLAMLAVPASLLVMALLTALAATDRVTQGSRRAPVAVLYVILGAALLMTA